MTAYDDDRASALCSDAPRCTLSSFTFEGRCSSASTEARLCPGFASPLGLIMLAELPHPVEVPPVQVDTAYTALRLVSSGDPVGILDAHIQGRRAG